MQINSKIKNITSLNYHVEQKSLALSILLHALVIAYFSTNLNLITIKKEQAQKVELQLTQIERVITPPKQVIDSIPTEKTEEFSKAPLEPKKLIKEDEKKPIKKNEDPNPKVIQKTEKSPITESQVQIAQPTVKNEETSAPLFFKEEKPQLEKIDFEIIRKKLFSNLIYPTIAQKNGWKGRTQIALTIDTNGKIVQLKISQPSGKKVLDDAVLMAGEKLLAEVLPRPKKTSTVLLDVDFVL